MSSRLHTLCLAGLFVACGALLGVACSSDSGTKVDPGAEGGAAGESAGGAAPTGGKGPTPSEAGQGGAPDIGAGGAPEAGAPSTSAGAGGEPDLGAAGAGPLACEPTGNTGVLTLDSENQQTVCRGAIVATNFNAVADASFTCCGVSDTPTPYTVLLSSGTDGIGGRTVVLQVPGDAPSVLQHITVTCSSGEAVNTVDLLVTDGVLPVVTTSVLTSITPNDSIQIQGTGLTGAKVTATRVSDAAASYPCNPNSASSTDTQIVCGFGGAITPGDYVIRVEKANCGFAAATLPLTVTQST